MQCPKSAPGIIGNQIKWLWFDRFHYDDVIMGAIAYEITSLTIVYSSVYSGADQSKHQSSASLAFVWGIHRGPVNSPHKWPVTRKMFPFDDVIMSLRIFFPQREGLEETTTVYLISHYVSYVVALCANIVAIVWSAMELPQIVLKVLFLVDLTEWLNEMVLCLFAFRQVFDNSSAVLRWLIKQTSTCNAS